MSISNGLIIKQHRANLEYEILVYSAARDGKLYRLKVFLDQNSKQEVARLVSARTHGATPLIIACRNGHYDVATYLIEECNANIEERGTVVIDGDTAEGATPLWVAARAGHLDLVIYLVKREASINATTKSNSTPLRAACYSNHFDVAKYLVVMGANKEIANKHGHTCLMIACYKGFREIAEFLISERASVNRKSSNGNTALHDCAEAGHLDILKLLLRAGAAFVPDSSGKTPLLSAAVSGHREIVEYFIAEYPCTELEKINALELLGATFVDVKRNLIFAQNFWKRALKMRYKGIPIEKPETRTPLACHLNVTEFRTLDGLEELISNPDAMRIQSLLVRERVLGSEHYDNLYHIRKRGEAYANSGEFQRCIKLWMYALDVQPKDQEPLSQATQRSLLSFTGLFAQMMSEGWQVGEEQPIVSFCDIFHVFKRAVSDIETAVELSLRQNQKLNDLKLHQFLSLTLHLVRMICRLHCYMNTNQVSDFKEVLYKLVHLNPKGKNEWTLLHIACSRDTCSGLSRHQVNEFSSIAVVDILLEVGASPHALDSSLNTPLHVAAINKPFVQAIFNSLLNHGSHLDQCNSKRKTPP